MTQYLIYSKSIDKLNILRNKKQQSYYDCWVSIL